MRNGRRIREGERNKRERETNGHRDRLIDI